MSKLLSDEELLKRIKHLTDGQLEYYEYNKSVYSGLIDLINTQKHLAYSQGVNDALFDPTGKSNEKISARNKRLEEANNV